MPPEPRERSVTDALGGRLEMFCCPRCGGDLEGIPAGLACPNCPREFIVDGGIPRFFEPNEWVGSRDDVTESMKRFYEATPFPDYDEFDSAASLLQKARRGLAAKALDDQIPFGVRILEAGCGTGQLANFLSIANRHVWATDMCENSLRLAEDFRRRNDLGRAHFLQMNLFRPCFKPGSFNLVISNGVLHHTSDPRLGFLTLSRLVKPGGYILIGLYHRQGRWITDLRRRAFGVTGDRLLFLDKRVSSDRFSAAKRRAWFQDQYKNPHESKHTLGEVLDWFEEAGVDFVSSIPSSRPFRTRRDLQALFVPRPPGNLLQRAAVGLAMMFRGGDEGGFFMALARRPTSATRGRQDPV